VGGEREGDKEGGRGKKGEMTQTLYAQKKKINLKKCSNEKKN
jgi:hypothetical protein